MPTGFSIDEQSREIHDIVEKTVRATGSHGTHVTNQMDLAKAWLAGRDDEWAQNANNLVNRYELPYWRIRRNTEPFILGSYQARTPESEGRLVVTPPFMSPGVNMARNGNIILVPALGHMGGHRYTNLHEVGHFIEDAMNLKDEPSRALKFHRGECRADGFAVAWAVATGADPVESVQQIAAYRAVGAIHDDQVSSIYYTFPVLKSAAMVGLRHRNTPHPVGIMEDLDREVRRHDLAPDIVLDLHPRLSLQDLNARHPNLYKQVRSYLPHHISWSREQDTQWMQAVVEGNPAHAPTLSRAPYAIALAKTENPLVMRGLQQGGAPRASDFLTSATAQLAAGPDRATALAALSPTDPSPAAQADALLRASRIFSRDDEIRIQNGLEFLAEATALCQAPTPPLPPRLRGDEPPSSPRSFLLIDARGGTITGEPMYELVASMRGQPIAAIGVVHKDPERAYFAARRVRALSNTFSASIHPMTPDRLAEKLPDIQQQIQSGKVWVVGNMPELPNRTARAQDKTRNHDLGRDEGP